MYRRLCPLLYFFSSIRSFASLHQKQQHVTSFGGYVSDKWKILPLGKSEEFRQHDEKLHNFLRESVPEALPHTGATTFDSHLRGVQSVLRRWGAPEYLANAGLFHSLYGTEGFQGYKLSVTRRPAIRSLIGPKAERLVWIFCMVDRLSVDKTVNDYSKGSSQKDSPKCFTSRDELGRFEIPLNNDEEWLDFLELSLADWLEQVEGAAEKTNPLYGWQLGEAWKYRRVAYARMAEILATHRKIVCKDMWIDVYSKESDNTRYLHQERTPPMSAAAREAREAIESDSL